MPDCSGYEVEIGPDSTNDIYTGRFQVSPVHTTGNKSQTNFYDIFLLNILKWHGIHYFFLLLHRIRGKSYCWGEFGFSGMPNFLSLLCFFILRNTLLYIKLSIIGISEIVCKHHWANGEQNPVSYKFCVLLLQITRQLELDSSQWLQSNSSGKGFLCNEVATTESYHCPESQWSDTSGKKNVAFS